MQHYQFLNCIICMYVFFYIHYEACSITVTSRFSILGLYPIWSEILLFMKIFQKYVLYAYSQCFNIINSGNSIQNKSNYHKTCSVTIQSANFPHAYNDMTIEFCMRYEILLFMKIFQKYVLYAYSQCFNIINSGNSIQNKSNYHKTCSFTIQSANFPHAYNDTTIEFLEILIQ